ncbi:MAG: hypothetical protein AUI14_07450 [Actinobacteria bacterium 13_2_20CM_2_71_6]|nr:MAG: hypothetical protein AUI14_07450 [Actinobacteria bacterium 13_2_20CM_2_71_6]
MPTFVDSLTGLLRFAQHRLRHHPVVVRIAGSTTMRQRAAKVVSVARWLAERGIPAVRLLPEIDQPVLIDEQVATLWHAVQPVGPAPNGTDLGRLLRQLHTTPDAAPELPPWQPLQSIRSRLADAEGLDPDSYAFLSQACDDIEAALVGVRYALTEGVIHGDATVANLIPGPAGPVICDFDSTSIGPREWDLTPVATGHLRFANKANNQTLLAATYGFDVTAWEGFPAFRRLRELQLVTSVVPVLRSNPALRERWQHRLLTFRAGDEDARWELYG